jgi:sulfite reductase (NADPH) hemoprotein beta-component
MSEAEAQLSPVEHIKARSNFLRGSILQGLADGATGALAEDDTQLSKFHGFYQQDDRDLRNLRRKALLEPDYSFMIRARVPGGICTPKQWLALDAIARKWANGTLRLTTRQAFQFHGILKRNLKPSIRAINDSLLDTIAACGDVNRNVMSSPLPESSVVHRQVCDIARQVSHHLTPQTTAYHEIWLSDGKIREKVVDTEPVYGPTYLPRKFKMSFAIPPRNDVDAFAHDLSFVAITRHDQLEGFNVLVGGGMGATHGDAATYPRLADVIGFCTPDQVVAVSEAVVVLQRDNGDRTERKHARLKYTIDSKGLDWFRSELEAKLEAPLQSARPFEFHVTGDRYGWQKTPDGLWHLGLFIENGRIQDHGTQRQLSGLRAIARILQGEFRLTPNQNVMISGVREADRAVINQLVGEYGLDNFEAASPLRLHSLACVGFPTCGLAMAESERYLPDLVGDIEALMASHGLAAQAVTIRMTGCPNGCARPYLAEIGLVGKGPGLYNLHLGAAHNGTRLARLFRESVGEAEILSVLDTQFAAWSAERLEGETFGDYLLRSGRLADSQDAQTSGEAA